LRPPPRAAPPLVRLVGALRLGAPREVEARPAEDDRELFFFTGDDVREREEDDARVPPFVGVRFAVAVAPLRVFLGAMSP